MLNIQDLIKFENENSGLDFKLTQYKKENYIALLKDIISMANTNSKEDRYIIIGLKPDKESRGIKGIEEDIIDSATYQQLIFENIEPLINIEYNPYQFDDKTLGVFRIYNCDNPPYLMKKDYNNGSKALKKGEGFIRKGTTQLRLSRLDYDDFYKSKSTTKARILLNDKDVLIEDDVFFQQKVIIHKLKTPFESQLEILSKPLFNSKMFSINSKIEKARVNNSLYELDFKLINEGETPIENVKVYFEFEGNHQNLLDSNRIHTGFTESITSITKRSNYFKILNKDKIEIVVNDMPILGTDFYEFKKTYLKIDNRLISEIKIKWKLLSKSLIKEGVINLKLTPKIKTIRTINYVEDLLSERNERLELEDWIEDED